MHKMKRHREMMATDGAVEVGEGSADRVVTWWDGKLMHLGYRGIEHNTHFLFCSQNARGVMHQTRGAQAVGNATPTCITCIGTVPRES
jgi:hypothetical protein